MDILFILKSMPIVGKELSSLSDLFSEEYLARSQLFPTVLSPIMSSFNVGGSADIRRVLKLRWRADEPLSLGVSRGSGSLEAGG